MAVPLPQAAAELGIPPGTLRRWIRHGAPVARRGRRGRGNVTLVDPVAIQSWRDDGVDAAIRTLAAELPELLAESVWQVHQHTPDDHRRQVAPALAAAWYTTTTALLDRLREHAPDIHDPVALPEKIERIRAF